MNKNGFSLIELMVTLVICCLTIGFISLNFNNLNRLVTCFTEYVIFKEQYLIFLLQFEDDYQQADLLTETDLDSMDNMEFRDDRNNDGDYDDSSERIAYRWDSPNNKIDRKSGEGSFQALLDGVSGLKWTQTSSNPLCHQLKLSNIFSEENRIICYCRPFLRNQTK